MMKDELYEKYKLYRAVPTWDVRIVPTEFVESIPGAEVTGFFFVLRPQKDVHARVALAAYIESCARDFPKLSEDLRMALDLSAREDEKWQSSNP